MQSSSPIATNSATLFGILAGASGDFSSDWRAALLQNRGWLLVALNHRMNHHVRRLCVVSCCETISWKPEASWEAGLLLEMIWESRWINGHLERSPIPVDVPKAVVVLANFEFLSFLASSKVYLSFLFQAANINLKNLEYSNCEICSVERARQG